MFARLLALFIGIPLIELYLFMAIGTNIGIPATFATIIITGILGAWLTKQQGLRTLAKYQQALSEGRLPHEEVIEGIMILAAGAVLLTPGFLTDVIGFLLLVPPVRSTFRKRLAGYLKDRIHVAGATMQDPDSPPSKRPADSPVIEIEAEVMDEKTPQP